MKNLRLENGEKMILMEMEFRFLEQRILQTKDILHMMMS